LLALADACKIDPRLDREPNIERRLTQSGRTYISYGRVLYKAPDYPLFGRWHIDANNSFWSAETGLEGLVEVARMSKLPVQRAARRSIGTGISSIQLDRAYGRGVLIPWKKTQPEAWKSAALLLKSDRGGLVYQPIVGVYEDVIELDFVSMYPTIMVRRNVSPETLNCACCPPSADVPELGYTICKRRDGLVSRALEPIIEKRRIYKKLMREASDPDRVEAINGRQSSLKWLLVCCFGYLGYRNARFGRIEAHESTCAFSRELLMRAKEASEARGFEVIHGIVDCLWLRKPGATDEAVAALCREIERATDLSIAVEGRYRWIAFLPSRQNPEMPIPNRYFGCFTSGKLKYRGIEARRSDQAPFVRQFQLRLIERLASARTLAECRAMREELAGMVHDAEQRLRGREVPIAELILRRKTSMAADEYRGNSMTAVAARQAKRAGIDLHAGEAVCFLVTRSGDRDPDARLRVSCLLQPEDAGDVDFYIDHLRRAAATVLEPLLGEPLARILGIEEIPPPRNPVRTEQLTLFDAWAVG
jgi:DNA polymerase-2